jgi:hypothetical protein
MLLEQDIDNLLFQFYPIMASYTTSSSSRGLLPTAATASASPSDKVSSWDYQLDDSNALRCRVPSWRCCRGVSPLWHTTGKRR